MKRQCGDCQLCCRLLPVRALGKKANERCRHQKFKKGCAVYNSAAMPPECKLWNCRWLVNDDAAELGRPDRSHYVVDIMPDFITTSHNETGERQHVQVVQIWCDPAHPEAHRDPALRRWLHRRAEQGIAAIVRFEFPRALILFAPPLAHDGQWHEVENATREQPHSFAEIVSALASDQTGGPR
jgi:hypothetical protein